MGVTEMKRKARKNKTKAAALNQTRKMGNLGTYAKAKPAEETVSTENN